MMVKKILIFDTIFPIGHKDLYQSLITLFPENVELLILNASDFYNESNENSSIQYKKIIHLKERKNLLLNQIVLAINTLIGIIYSYSYKSDIVVFFTFDTLNIAIMRFLFGKKEVYLLHHNNTDHLQNKYKKRFFDTYKNKVKHIVFADFIGKYLVGIGVNQSNVYVLTHPLNGFTGSDINKNNINKKIYIGLGYANDELLISQIINYENKYHLLYKNDILLIIRSRVQKAYEYKNIRIINGHLPKDEYESIYESSQAVLLLYSVKYMNRYSGVILDAFRHKKKIIGINIPIVKYFSRLYPNNCRTFNSVEDLFLKLIQFNNTVFSDAEYNQFLTNHSDQKIRKEIIEIFSLK